MTVRKEKMEGWNGMTVRKGRMEGNDNQLHKTRHNDVRSGADFLGLVSNR